MGNADDEVNIRKNLIRMGQKQRRNYGDDARSEVLLDGGNNICSFLYAVCQFPVAGSPIQTSFGGETGWGDLKI